MVGAFAFEYLLHVFKDITKHWQLLMGGFIVLVVLTAPRGLLGMVTRLRANSPSPAAPPVQGHQHE